MVKSVSKSAHTQKHVNELSAQQHHTYFNIILKNIYVIWIYYVKKKKNKRTHTHTIKGSSEYAAHNLPHIYYGLI